MVWGSELNGWSVVMVIAGTNKMASKWSASASAAYAYYSRTFWLGWILKQVKVYSLEESDHIVFFMKTCTFPMEITKQRAQSLWMKMQNAKLNLKRSYSHLQLVAACSKIAWASVKVRKTKLLSLVLLRAQKEVSKQALHWQLVGSLPWDDQRMSVTTLHVSVVWAIEHIYCRQIARFHWVCSESQGMLSLVKFVKILKQKFESELTVINPRSVLW